MEIYDSSKKMPDIDIFSPSYLERLEEYYGNRVITPRCPYDIFSKDIMEWFDLERTECGKLDQMTFDILDSSAYRRDEVMIWRVMSEKHAELFFQYYRARYVYGGAMCIVYDPASDCFFSNCSLLECYLTIVRGIEKEDVAHHTRVYQNYLNTMYLYDEAVIGMKQM